MSAYIELLMPGDSRATIEASSILAIVTSKGGRSDIIATAEKPLKIVLRGDVSIDVYGESPRSVFHRAELAKIRAKEHKAGVGLDFYVDALDRQVRDELSA